MMKSRLQNSFNCTVLILSCVAFICVIMTSLYLPNSKIYKRSHDSKSLFHTANLLNEARRNRSLEYFRRLNSFESKRFYKAQGDTHVDLVICVVTKSRVRFHKNARKLGYLLQTLSEMDKLVKEDNFYKRKVMFVCNVQKPPTRHFDFELTKSYFPYVQKYGMSDLPKNITVPVQEESDKQLLTIVRRETLDYVFCMNASISFNSSFVLILEDDVIPHKDVFQLMKFTADKIVHRPTRSWSKSGKQWAFLKLYYPIEWQGFENNLVKILELLSFGSAGSGIFVLLLIYCSRCGRHKQRLTFSAILIYFVHGFIFTIISIWLIGRQNVLELRRISPYLYTFSQDSGCCMPAVLYPREAMTPLMHYINNSTGKKDIELSNYLWDHDVPGYMLEPNLFHHTGMYSSRYGGHNDSEAFVFSLR